MAQSIKDKALKRLKRQLETLNSSSLPIAIYLPQWKDRTIRMLENIIVDAEINLFADTVEGSWEKEAIACEKFLVELIDGINENPEFFLVQDNPIESKSNSSKSQSISGTPKSNKVFIVHGHDSLIKTEVARTLEQLGLNVIILHEQPNEGKTIIEKFEREALQVSFAVVLLTPDDIGYPKGKEKDAKPRARQNVVLELGYFSGILGRSNVCVLHKDGVEIPSDYLGVIYIPLDKEDAWKYKLSKELKKANLDVDLNKLL